MLLTHSLIRLSKKGKASSMRYPGCTGVNNISTEIYFISFSDADSDSGVAEIWHATFSVILSRKVLIAFP